MKMVGEDQVDEEGMAGPGGYYNHLDLQRTASNVDGTLTYVLQNIKTYINYPNKSIQRNRWKGIILLD